jgi:hypothetical protein
MPLWADELTAWRGAGGAAAAPPLASARRRHRQAGSSGRLLPTPMRAVTRRPRARRRFPTRADSRRGAPPPSDQTGHPRQRPARASGSRFRHESLDAAIAPSPRERSKSRSRSRPPGPPCVGHEHRGRRGPRRWVPEMGTRARGPCGFRDHHGHDVLMALRGKESRRNSLPRSFLQNWH